MSLAHSPPRHQCTSTFTSADFELDLDSVSLWEVEGESDSMARTSSSNVAFNSFEALRNSAKPFPRDLPSSGSLRGPKTIRATTKIMINSGTPIEPMLILLRIIAYYLRPTPKSSDQAGSSC